MLKKKKQSYYLAYRFKEVDMTQERTSMRNVKEVIRLHNGGMTQVGIAGALRISRGTVQNYVRRWKASGIDAGSIGSMEQRELEMALFPDVPSKKCTKEIPDLQKILEELRRPHATLEVLWEEYRQENPDGYGYSHFCELMRKYRKTVNYSMRQEHKAGEKTFVDFGEGPVIRERKTGIETKTKLFVSVWGASAYLYAQVVADEGLANWIKTNRMAFEYFGCCPKAVVPDNLKAAVTKACRYEPYVHPTYLEFSRHYDTVILPARPYRPKDKAKAENGVGLAQRWIVFRLRNRVFYSIAEAQEAVIELVEKFNERIMKKWGKSRRELFLSLDKPHAKNLPEQTFEYADWKKVKVQFNYHVNYDGHDYSVPYTLIHSIVEIRASSTMIEVYQKGKRMCSHRRSYQKQGATTQKEHMPVSHQKYAEWTPERIREWAWKYGDAVKELVERIMESRNFPEQAYKACLGIIRLGNKFSKERLNNACQRALKYRSYSYRSVVSILEKGLDHQKEQPILHPVFERHENLRGADYYQEQEVLYPYGLEKK
jgi:transposase